MNNDRKRIFEIRLIVIVLVDVTDPTLADLVSAEVASNLESVSYVESAIVSPL